MGRLMISEMDFHLHGQSVSNFSSRAITHTVCVESTGTRSYFSSEYDTKTYTMAREILTSAGFAKTEGLKNCTGVILFCKRVMHSGLHPLTQKQVLLMNIHNQTVRSSERARADSVGAKFQFPKVDSASAWMNTLKVSRTHMILYWRECVYISRTK